MRKIAVFTGTRAEYGLLSGLLMAIKADPALELQLVVSGMHLAPEFGLTWRDIEADGHRIDAKVEMLLSSDSAVGVAKSIGVGIIGLSDALARLAPDIIVILGDRFEALAAAQTALILRIPILHIHGGEVTEGAYDDAIRHAITKMSLVHCTSTESHRDRVIQMGEAPERVHHVGALGLEQIERTRLMALEALAQNLAFRLRSPYFLVTWHPETLSAMAPSVAFMEVLAALDQFPNHQIILTYPNADEGGRTLIPILESWVSTHGSRAVAVPSLGQQRYLSAMSRAAAVIGNSSSGIIEAPYFKVPTIDIGQRQLGREAAASVSHCAAERWDITHTIQAALNRAWTAADFANPYWLPDTSARILAQLKSMPLTTRKRFFDQ